MPQQAPESSPSPKKPEKPAPPKRAESRGQKWRRRLTRIIVVAVVVVLIMRALVHVLLPPVLRKVARTYGLNASYDRLEIETLGGDAGLWGLRLTSLEGGKPFLESEYCRASISTFGLLRGKLTVKRVEAEGAKVYIERTANGEIPLINILLAAKPVLFAPGQAVSLEPPLTIDVLRLQDASARFVDYGIHPATDVTVNLNALVRDVGVLHTSTSFELSLHSPQALAALYVTGAAVARQNTLQADLAIRMFGLDLTPANTYLAPFGVIPVSRDLDARATGRLVAQINTSPPSTTRPATTAPFETNISAKLDLTDVRLLSDAQQAAAIDRVHIDAASITPSAVRLDQVIVTGLRAAAGRSNHGRLNFAGIELVPMPATQPSADRTIPLVIVRELKLNDADLSFIDDSISPRVAVGLKMPTMEIANVCSDPTRAEGPTKISLSASAPGLAKSITVEGTGATEHGAAMLDLSVDISGIDAVAADPYLAKLKITRRITDGHFACKLQGRVEPKDDGSLGASVKVTDANLSDGAAPLLAMPLIDIHGASFTAGFTGVRVDSIALVGPSVDFRRGKAGIIDALGIQFEPASTVSAILSQWPSTSSATTQPFQLPSIAVGKFTWRNAAIRLSDTSGDNPINVSLSNLIVDGDNLALDLSSSTPPKPGKLHVSFKSPGVADRFDLDGTLQPGPQSLGFDIRAQSDGLSAQILKPILSAFDIEPLLTSATLRFSATGKVEQTKDRFQASVNVGQFALTDGPDNWLSANGASIVGASFDGKVLVVDSINLDHPSAIVKRAGDGHISLAGFRLPPLKVPDNSALYDSQIDLSLPFVVRMNKFDLHDSHFDLTDATVTPPANLSAAATASAANIIAGESGAATTFSVMLSSPGVVKTFAAAGSAKLAPKSQEIRATATATGIDSKAIAAYLPPNVSTHFNNGTLAAKLAANFDQNPQGGTRGKIVVSEFALRDDAALPPGISVNQFILDITRFDWRGKRIDIHEITLDRAMLNARQDNTGLSLCGIQIAPAPLDQASPPRPASKHSTTEVSDVNALLAQANVRAPLVTIDKISIAADRITLATPFVDEPIVLTHLSLTNPSRIELFGDDPTRLPAFDLNFATSVDKSIDSLTLNSHVAPFAGDPSASIDLAVTGIHGNGILALFPQFKSDLDAADLSDGQFKAQAEAQFSYARRGLLGIDFTRDITANFEVKNLALTQSGVARPLAGLDNIRGEGVRFSPTTGALAIKSIDASKPSATIYRDAAGIHLLGLTVKVPMLQPATRASSTQSLAAAPPIAAPKASPTTAPENLADYTIDRLTVNGADVRLEDRVADPVMVLPINQLDVDVKGLSSRAFTEPNRPVRFSVLVGAGKVPLPPRKPKEGVTTEEREAFSEASAVGNVTLVPKPQGYVKASLSGLELTAISGVAREYGIILGGATFDVRADVRMRGADTFDARIYPTFNELRLSEAPDGPIQRALKLPVPPDAAIGLMEDADGSISFPLTVPIEAGNLQWDAIYASGVGSLSGVLVGAIAAAPLKAANIIPMLGGADLQSSRTKHIEPIVMEFAPGESQLNDAQQEQLRRLIDQMRRDSSLAVTVQHTLGQGDVEIAEQRTNPLAGDSMSIAIELRRRKYQLQEQLLSLNGQVRAAMASQNSIAVSAGVDSLRSVATELKETEDALDQALDLLRPGADRQTQRRTRTGAILLGELRLAAIQDVLLHSALPSAPDRIRKAGVLFNPADTDASGKVTLVLIKQSKK